MPMDRDREEELMIAEILILGAMALGLLDFIFWNMLGTKGPVMSATESIIIVCVVILIFYGFYLALFGEKKMKRLVLIGEKKRRY